MRILYDHCLKLVAIHNPDATFLDDSNASLYNSQNDLPLSMFRPQRKTKIISASFAVSAVKNKSEVM